MKLRNRIFLLLLPALLLFSELKAQTPHEPVTAGGSNTEQTDTTAEGKNARYKAAQERDRERIRAALKQSRDNVDAINKPREDLQTKKLFAKIATYAVFGILALLFYIRKRKKANNDNDDIRTV